ncbi:MAG: class I adenylate-forming enzyme family protein [Gemmatimonadota bacterium]
MPLSERPRGLNTFDALARRAEVDPEGVFLVYEDQPITFGRVERQALALAAGLANLGVERGDRVALILPGCPEFIVSFFAVARLGAVLVPLDPTLSEAELRYMLRHSEATCAIAVEKFQDVDYLERFEEFFPLLPELQYLVTVGEEDLWYDDRIFQFEDLLSSGKGLGAEIRGGEDPSDLLAIVYTSGTTGKPKGVELSHSGLIHAARATADAVGLSQGDRAFGVTALFHVFGLGPGILGSVLSGASLVLQREFDATEALDLIERQRVTVHYGVPTVFASELREQRRRPRDLSSLRTGLVAGAPMGESLFRQVERDLCPRMLAAYSMTETSSTLAVTSRADPPERRWLTVGRPIADTSVRVLGPGGVELPPESLGEIVVRGPGVMRGYYRQPLESSRSFDSEGYLRTGDLGMVDEEGTIHLVGRGKEVIIRSGSNVYPREVEDRLHAHPAIRDAVVIGSQDELLGEAVCALLVPVEGAIVTETEVREWCRRTLADHKVPDVVRFFDSLPRTGTGEVRRVGLGRLLESHSTDPMP